ncbi:M13 family metallopeptidase [Sphingomonas sabuli]|uniref:M13 family metallopeptidase n=1 Tax=Sphingomonas sabuli TaxID=2764186 RepID=A0A7G9L4V3_9SPHN|nr:M13 family metallopeptidase [Sphingomonas sabuli]QNM83652.1 M13 family metallopeptidase [Sphingomonas sabuli]
MVRHLLLAGAACFILASASAASAQAPAAAPDLSTPPPLVFPAWGFDVSTIDTSVDPGDDFDAYVNGKWKAATPIPAKYPYYGVSQNLQIVSEAAVREVIKEAVTSKPAQGSVEQKISDLYVSYLDRPTIDSMGIEPAKPYLAQIDAAASHADILNLFVKPGFSAALSPGIDIDPDNPDAYLATFSMGGLALPTRDNYLVENERNIDMRAKYIDYLTFLLDKAGVADSKTRAERLYAMEKQIAVNEWDPAVMRNPELTNNLMTRAQILALAPDLPLGAMIDNFGFTGVERFNVPQMPPSAQELDEQKIPPELRAKIGGGLPAQLALFKATPVDVWKDWLKVRFLASNAAVLPSEIDNASFAFNSAYLYGVKAMKPRPERALSTVNSSIGEAVGKVYVERNFPASSKAAMIDLVDNLRKAMALNIAEVEWMGDTTRAAARQKLDSLRVKIGYPNKFETYDSLTIVPGKALDNRLAVARWGRQDALQKFAKPVDRDQWFMTPQTVNAYYVAQLNEIVFPAAYLQAPNFNPKADPAVNYAAIGSTIGHEIGHGFDDSGARYDSTGRLRDWWTAEDKANFQALGNRLATQYSAYCPFDSGKTCVNGKLTLGENIGDLSGLAIAYRAYKLSLDGKEAPVIDGLTGDQRFFIAYAQKYRNKWSEQLQRVIMESDPHSPDVARVNEVLRNFDPWYKAFNVTPDDKMYLPPSQRVTIW